MLKKTCQILFTFAISLAMVACQPAIAMVTQMPTDTATLIPSKGPTPLPKDSTSTPTLTLEPASAPTLLVQEQMGSLYEVVVTIPVGEGGIRYHGADSPNMEITGPNALAVLPNGNFVVADLIGNRLLQYNISGHLLIAIDLYALGILNVSDLRATEAGLYVLEIFLGPVPETYRVHHLSFEGDLKTSYEIPNGYHLENGLSGISIGSEGQILLELEGGARLYQLDEQSDKEPIRATGYPFFGRNYEIDNPAIGETAAIQIDDLKLETRLSMQFGGFTFLQAFPDGSFFILREDVVNFQVIQVDQTVHYISPDGVQLGIARVPLAESYYPVRRNLAVGPGGDVFALLPLPDAIHIVRLNFYKHMEPLIPGAVEPAVTMSNK